MYTKYKYLYLDVYTYLFVHLSIHAIQQGSNKW